jgi:hypothetical protein
MPAKAALLDPPVAAETSRPGTPLEASLVAAYELRGPAAVDAAEQAATSLNLRVERLSAELATTPNRIGELHKLLIEQHDAVHRHHYLQALSVGEQTEPLPPPDIDADLVVRYARARPEAFGRLTALCEAQAVTAEAKAAASRRRLAAYRGEFGRGAYDLAAFLDAISRELTEQTQLREQSTRLRNAAQAAQAVLRRDIGGVLGNRATLQAALRECSLLAVQTPAPVVERLQSELRSVESELQRLEGEPGPIAAALQAQRDDLVSQIKSRKRETVAQTGSNAAELIERCNQGSGVALAELVRVIRSRPLAFRPQLDVDLVELLADSLAESPAVFAELILK